jgi:hypothetical protein
MGTSGRCIGGIANNGTSVRLLTATGQHYDTSCPFQIGQVWELSYTPSTKLVAPHLEDVRVTASSFVSIEQNLRSHLLGRLTPPWTGSIDQIFGGLLGYTGNNNGYISELSGIPSHSTWFWIPDSDLSLRSDNKHYDYRLSNGGLSYTGEPAPIPTIVGGTLVRVSLARWWKPDGADDTLEERCYLQLSGWYD